MYNIYIIQNKINDKIYVGQTTQGEKRLRNHRYYLNKGTHTNPYLQNAWNSYGPNAFDFYILDSLDTREEMSEAEVFYIKWYKDLDLSYNFKSGGEGGLHSEESKLKMSISHRNMSEETKLKMSKSAKNISYEIRFKRSESAKNISEETRLKMSESAKNRQPMSEETKLKLKNRVYSEEFRQKVGEASKGRIWSEETRQKQREARKNISPISEETRLKMSESAKNRQPMSEETKLKLSLARKGNTNAVKIFKNI